MRPILDSRLDLITGEITAPSDDELAWEEHMTAKFKKQLGDCDGICRYTEPYGWVPECGCPIHDPD